MIKRIIFYVLGVSLIFSSVYVKAQASQQQTAILLYHHLVPNADKESFSDNGLVISKESFAQQMEYLYKNQYHTITTDELREFLYNKKPLAPKSVMITFDDGYMSNYIFAYPILKQYGFNAVIFAITGNIQTKDQEYHPDMLDMLSWMQVAASTDVFEYGSHTNTLHTPVNGISGFTGASLDEAEADLQRSQKRINNYKLFSYPLGQHNTKLVDMLRNNGVDLAFTNNKGYVIQNNDPFLLNRVTIYSSYDLKIFENIVTCKYK